ncbi:MAG: ATP-binding cassette domain-containing protein [Thermodesulfovibrionales bacterium]|jgi:phospholipid/cholesterol/gamma-HCH transport system ATP-binding protein|nr:ATP-binding cassette domain-containing protein [Thermodesulfovibrionales bacterium]
MIVFDKVCFSYGVRQIIKDLSFSINSDERVAILGGSGEGKTTILKLIMGLIKPDSGKIIIDGEDITGKTEDELREVRMKFSLVFQEGALFDSLNVKENVAFCLREYTKMTEDEIDRKVRELLRTVGVEHAMEFMPEELSGGMHRRVSIARSLAACEPMMFLYDEPTSGLDPVNADNICKLILELSKDGKGFIIVTHKVVDALRVASRFIFLKDGELVFDGDSEKLLHSDIPDIQVFISELNYAGVKNV